MRVESDEPPGELFVGLFWSILATLVFYGAIAVVAWAAGAGWSV